MSAVRAVPEKRRPEQSAAGPTPAGFVLGLDVGSSVIRCHVYDHATLIRGSSAQKVESLYPQAGWVEIDPDALWLQFVTVIKESVRVAGIEMNQIVGLGISTQRATFITWNKKTGNHFHNFISWQDLRAVELVKSWNNSLIMKLLQNSCRVLHFFTRNKRFLAVSLFNFTNQHVSLRLAWILQNLVEVQKAVAEDNCCFGTLDTWLLHKLTKGSEFATDFSNASATGLFDPYKMHWSGLLASLLSIPLSILPPVKDTSHNFGSVDEEIFGVPIPIVAMIWSQAATRSKVNFQQHLGTTRNMGMVPHELFEFMCFSLFLRAVAETARWLCPELAVLPGAQLSWQKSLPRAKFLAFQTTIPLELLENSSKIPQELAVVADQQSAMFGECCFHAGDVKLTMGTGTFLDINTGNNLQHTIGGFYPLIGWKIGQEVVCLAESNAGDTGTIIKWAQELDLFTDAAETEKMAKSLEDSEGVCFVPSFSGLQAPLNDPCACASFMGLKPSTNKYHLVRAILESIAFRNKQLYELMQKEIHIPVTKVRADGGVCKNNFVMQMTSDLINANIERPVNIDMSCLGAASLAGLAIGFWTDKEELKKLRQSEVVFEPQKKWQEYEMSMENWVKAVKRSMNWYNKM